MSGEVEFNWPVFDKYADSWRAQGYTVVSPAEMDRVLGFTLEDPPTWEQAMGWDEKIIPTCTMMWLIPGWEKSRGVRRELRCALKHGIPVFSALTGDSLQEEVATVLGDDNKFKMLEGGGEPTDYATFNPPHPLTELVWHATEGHPGRKIVGWNHDIQAGPQGPIYADDGEVRVVDPKTGGVKGSKQAQLGAMDPLAIMEIAKVAGMGAVKYDRYNFLRGYRWSLSYDACQRHLHAFWGGEDLDEESGLYHLAHAAWHCLCLIAFSIRKRGTDDRPT